jgi:hypothetical protein
MAAFVVAVIPVSAETSARDYLPGGGDTLAIYLLRTLPSVP